MKKYILLWYEKYEVKEKETEEYDFFYDLKKNEQREI